MVLRTRCIRMSLTALSLLGTNACASLTTPESRISTRASLLTVENRGWEDVIVYVVRGGAALRVGTVSGLSSEVIALSGAMTGTGEALHLRARRRLTGEQFDSQPLMMHPGAVLRLIVEQIPGFSSVMVR